MTDEESFIAHARNLLRAPKVSSEACEPYRGDHAKLASVPLPHLIALDTACPLETDADAKLALAIVHAIDARSVDDWERALVEMFPPPDEFDANADRAHDTKVVVHPVHGVGIVELDSMQRGWRARVRFRDGERTFDNAQWSHPTRVFRREAGLALITKVDSASEDAFWSIVEAIDWGSGRPIIELAAALVPQVSFVDCIALHGRTFDLGSDLRRRIETWEETAGDKLPCGDDSFGDLTQHIIGLGRATYLATMENPALAMARAEARDYRESFSYVFQYAQEMYPIADVQAALRALAPAALVDEPVLGPGLEMRENQIAFATRTVIRTPP